LYFSSFFHPMNSWLCPRVLVCCNHRYCDSLSYPLWFLIYWVFISNISTCFFIISISSLNFSSMLLTFLSISWIDFLISYMFIESSFWLLIIFNK
jgi:hypothetical protein